MAITNPKHKKPSNEDEFIGGAPDAVAQAVSPAEPRMLKARRGTTKSQVSVVLADELVVKIDEKASQRYVSRSAFITMALTEFLERDG